MRIALVSDWFTPRVGGIEAQLSQLAERLGTRGHEVTVFTTTPGAVSGEHHGTVRLDGPRLPGIDLPLSPRTIRELRRRLAGNWDVVHAHLSVVSPLGYSGALIGRALGLRTIATFHSVLRAKRFVLGAVERLFRLSEKITWTAVSNLVARQASGALRRQVTVLPNGIDLDFWSIESGRTTASSTITFVSTMRLNRKKRPLALVEAFAQASASSRQPMRLVIAGVGPMRRDVRAAMTRLADEGAHVELLDRLTARELRALYARSDAFVTASRRESFGIAALEGLAAGLPVIAMREAGSSEFLLHERNALLCDDDQELARAMTRFAADASLRGRLRGPSSLRPYDWETVIDRHEAVYDGR